MTERDIPATTLLAGICWVAGLTLTIVNVFVEAKLGSLGGLCGVAGATLNVRGWFGQLRRREVNAFNLGRDSMRAVE
jgi:hypothetical protein